MPQVISVQRGTTSVTSENTVTLFTNSSSGFATRVIINQLSYSGDNSWSGTRNTGGRLIINGSGVGETQIGLVNSRNANQSFISPVFGPFNALSVNTQNSHLNYGNGYFTQTGFEFPSNTSLNMGSIMPQTFWIGPSDAVRTAPFGFRIPSGKSSAPSTVTIRYSFTLITEA